MSHPGTAPSVLTLIILSSVRHTHIIEREREDKVRGKKEIKRGEIRRGGLRGKDREKEGERKKEHRHRC